MCFLKKLNNNFLVVIEVRAFPSSIVLPHLPISCQRVAGQKAQGSQRGLGQSQGQGKPEVGDQVSKETNPSRG